MEPQQGAAQDRRGGGLEFALGEPQVLDLLATISRFPFTSRFRITSVKPKTPMATITNPMPSVSAEMLKVKRAMPEVHIVPIRPRRMPSRIMQKAFQRDPGRQNDRGNETQDHEGEIAPGRS